MSDGARKAGISFAVGVVLIGTALRLWNAWYYPTNWGFDAKFNWEYIELLRESWALRSPDTIWATSHPPLYYYLAAALNQLLGYPPVNWAVAAIRLLNVAGGVVTIALALVLVRRIDPTNTRRVLIAAVLLSFLPVHVYMSAMINEEILTSTLISIALFLTVMVALEPLAPRAELWRAAAIGLLAGLAWLTKLTGVLVLVIAVATYAWVGLRRQQPRAAMQCIALLSALALVSGGWYYAHNLWLYGYAYPFALPAHELMFSMPPGSRGALDYLYVPLATWTDPQLLAPDLLHSVWGSTYVTAWYDGHRVFLPRSGSGQQFWATALTLLGLVPTLGFLWGAGKGVARGLRARGADLPLLGFAGLTICGYAFFTLRNPWFASIKASYLLGLALPFAVYASEALDGWSRGHRVRGLLVGAALLALVVSVIVVFAYGLFLKKAEVPGLFWTPVESG
jgi:4-amino-4-deoxy-L-arabinose transferase-like glycosyltransferase